MISMRSHISLFVFLALKLSLDDSLLHPLLHYHVPPLPQLRPDVRRGVSNCLFVRRLKPLLLFTSLFFFFLLFYCLSVVKIQVLCFT